jgi:protein-S-isoprenylcysteine O-methyltransferase Ste14
MLLLLAAVFIPIGFYHRLRAHTGESIDRWQEGPVILLGLRLSALCLFAVMITWMINPAWLSWSSLPFPLWLRFAGFATSVGGALLWVAAVHSLGKNLTDTVVTRQDHTLVISGPYRFMRHPFYTACFIGFFGGILAMANWLFLAPGLLVVAFLIARTPIEEQKLIDRFGDAYRSYIAHTGKFLPRLPPHK